MRRILLRSFENSKSGAAPARAVQRTSCAPGGSKLGAPGGSKVPNQARSPTVPRAVRRKPDPKEAEIKKQRTTLRSREYRPNGTSAQQHRHRKGNRRGPLKEAGALLTFHPQAAFALVVAARPPYRKSVNKNIVTRSRTSRS